MAFDKPVLKNIAKYSRRIVFISINMLKCNNKLIITFYEINPITDDRIYGLVIEST